MTRRRSFAWAAAAAAGGVAAAAWARRETLARWTPEAVVKPERSTVAVLRAAGYESDLRDVVRRGFEACGVGVRGLRVVLKPNLVEFDPGGAINTHPLLVGATIEALLSSGAREVVVAEGAGHRRDTEYVTAASGLADVVRAAGVRYVDLNTDAVRAVAARSSFTKLGTLWLPATVLEADLLVSMPKLKTHHWAGVTLSMKNLFGIMPGAIYGWPKNLLHWQGIPASILDINASLPVPRFNIVDGIVGMEGNGPIQGAPRHSGVVVFGADPVAVDATGARLMGVDPTLVKYLAQADRFLGNAGEDRIEQRGDTVESAAQPYALPPRFGWLRAEEAPRARQ